MRDFIQKLALALQNPLPGKEAHQRMRILSKKNITLKEEANEKTRRGAVMLLLFPDAETLYFPLILRPPYEGIRSHGGQVAFPGGKKDERDEDLKATAIRETYEEIGVELSKNNILGALSEIFIPPSNIVVTPFVGFYENKPEYLPEPAEVSAIFETKLADLWKNDLRKTTLKEFEGAGTWEIPYFDLHNQIVWGATAAILEEFAEITRLVR